jgi:branched-chain amino acid aminotransferase
MINTNGNLVPKHNLFLSPLNRGFKYGDSLFETLKVLRGTIIFLEDHYFRLMASMRILRMEIPMSFTFDFFKNEILKTAKANDLTDARVRFSIFRNEGGLYLPENNRTAFIIEIDKLPTGLKNDYEIDIYRDHFLNSSMISRLKTNNKILNVISSIYAAENDLDNCILINEKKNIVEATNANIFLVKDNLVSTPLLSEGAVKGVVRNKIIEIIRNDSEFEITENEISPFELQKVDEVFLTNSIIGIQPVTQFRKTNYSTKTGKGFINRLREYENKV